MGFDPMGISDTLPDLNYVRAAEIKHGRISMLATVGFLVQSKGIHFPCPYFTENDPLKVRGGLIRGRLSRRGPGERVRERLEEGKRHTPDGGVPSNPFVLPSFGCAGPYVPPPRLQRPDLPLHCHL